MKAQWSSQQRRKFVVQALYIINKNAVVSQYERLRSAVETQLSRIERGIIAMQAPLSGMALALPPLCAPAAIPRRWRKLHYAATASQRRSFRVFISSQLHGDCFVHSLYERRPSDALCDCTAFMRRSHDDHCDYTLRIRRSLSVLVIFQSP